MRDKIIQHYHNVVKIIRKDFKSARSNPIVSITLIGIIIIPSLYALLNISACWDPYGNTEALDFAIVNNDKSVSYNGENVNIGNDVVKELKNNDKFNWLFVSEADAREGVKNGTYYAAIIIPSDFSSDVISITSDNPKSAQLEYLINEKTNPMASKLSDSAVKEIQKTVNAKIVQKIDLTAFETLESLQSTLASGASQLDAGASQVSSGASSVSTGSSAISAGASQVTSGASKVNSAASKISYAANTLQQSVNVSQIPDEKLRIVVGSSLALANSSSQLASSSGQVASGSSQLASSSVKLASGANSLASGSNELASSSANALNSISDGLDEVSSINKNSLGDYLYAPVDINRNELFSVDNYGTEVSPFYIVLSIWVGCLITCVMVKMRYLESIYTPLEMYFGKLCLFVVLAILQTTVTILGAFFLGISVANPGMFIFSMYVIAIVFMILVYSIISVFGNVGKAIVVVVLVLQISSTGGIYPVQLMSPFFQLISPFMPMTYAITMMRESTLGLLWGNYIPAFLVLLGILIVTLILSVLVKEKYDKRANYFEKCLQDSGLF